MPPPVPLTQTPPAQISFAEDGIPRSGAFGDIYYSVEGGLEETRQNFLKGCALPERWSGREHFTVGELGFGSGLNVLALWQLWEAQPPSQTARLDIVSVEGFPLSREELSRALAPWKELQDYAARLLELWPGRVKGWHRLELSKTVTLTLIHDPVAEALPQLNFAADSWFLDGFSPAKNPAMWRFDVMKHVSRLSAPGCRVGTFTVAGDVRRSLSQAGFDVSKKPGFGKKRERLEAILPGTPSLHSAPQNIAIIGAGIAAAMCARALCRAGIIPTIIAPKDSAIASGNPLAIVKPRLDLQDRPEARFFNSAYLFALQAYGPDMTDRSGVFHIAKDEKEAARMQKLCENAALPPAHFEFVASDYFEKAAGLVAPFGGLYFPRAKIVRPKAITDKAFEGLPRIFDKVLRVEDGEVTGDTGSYGPFDKIIIAIGAGIREFDPNSGLRFQRGQVTLAEGGQSHAVTYGGYAVPHDNGVLLGATHGRWDGKTPQNLDDDDAENLEGFTSRGGRAGDVMGHRTSVRVTTQDTLPKLYWRDERVLILTGLGGRGFVYAPLLGAQAAAMIMGTATPIAPGALEKFKL